MWQIVLANISIQGRVVDSNVYCFFYGPGHTLPLPGYYLEVVHCCCVASSVLMFKNCDGASVYNVTLFCYCFFVF